MRKSRALQFAEWVGALMAVAMLVYLLIQVDYYKQRLQNFQQPGVPHDAQGRSNMREAQERTAPCTAERSGQWHVTQFIVKSEHKPYVDLKLEYLLSLQFSADCSISGAGEKTHEAGREIKRDRRSQLTVVSAQLVEDRAVLNIHEDDFRGRKSHVVMTIVFTSADEFVGSARSSVADCLALVYGTKR